MRRLELLIPPLLVLMIFVILMWCIALLLPSFTLGIKPNFSLSIFMVLAGFLLVLISSASFIRVKTTLNPMRPELTSVLVKAGVYRYSRNPVYLGLLIMLLGWFVYLNNILAGLLVIAFVCYMNRFQIEPEEKALFKRYGAEFEDYKRLVRRWL